MQHQFYITKRLPKFYLYRIYFYFLKAKLFFKIYLTNGLKRTLLALQLYDSFVSYLQTVFITIKKQSGHSFSESYNR